MPQRPNPQFRWRLCGRLPGVGKNRGWRHLHAADLPVGHATQRAGRMRGGIECPSRRAGDEVPAERGSGAVWHMSTKASAMLARPRPAMPPALVWPPAQRQERPRVVAPARPRPVRPASNSTRQANVRHHHRRHPAQPAKTALHFRCMPAEFEVANTATTPANGETRNAAGACVPPTPPPPPPPPCPAAGRATPPAFARQRHRRRHHLARPVRPAMPPVFA